MKATKFRADLFKILSQAGHTGASVEIESKGCRFKLVPLNGNRNRLDNLHPHPDCIVGDPDELIQIDWMRRWQG
jgi:hypothetical protein